MCSILAILELQGDRKTLRALALKMSRTIRHRGPDWSGIWESERAILAHERLAIVDVEHGAQPLVDRTGKVALAVNGEIYNHRQIEGTLEEWDPITQSDCEVILGLWKERGPAFLNELNGIFAFVLYDATANRFLIARDPIGVIPLYTGRDAAGNLFVASELKALAGHCTSIDALPPGHYWDSADEALVRYYEPEWTDLQSVRARPADPSEIGPALEAAVTRQLMCDVPYGLLISGGLDSSVISAIAARHAKMRIEDAERTEAWWPRLHSFSIGLEGSPDLAAAAKVAGHLGTVHHGMVYTVQQGFDALRDVIYHLETYDITTVRAATPMYLMARKIRATGIKMVLSGEGADEVFGGYLYFHKAPNAAELHAETVRKVSTLHQFDCLRANKSMAAWGIEARVPFLDREFLDVAMRIDPELKMCRDGRMEKHVLRSAFEGLIPNEVLWRQKEQFSDGVGYGWIDSLRDLAEREVTDVQFRQAASRFPVNTPLTKEGFLYRAMFEEHFPQADAIATVPGGLTIACSSPTAIAWEAAFAEHADASGRAVDVHREAYDDSR
jgi:asparagine synthase (glutamine-hydrolysing)